MSDYPDWFGQPQFPQYGGALHYDSGFIEVNTTQTKTLISLYFKGRIKGGKIVMDGETEIPSGILKLTIDGGAKIIITINTLFLYAIYYPNVGPFYLLLRRDDIDKLVIAISPDVSINEYFFLEVTNNSADNFQAAADIYYERIE